MGHTEQILDHVRAMMREGYGDQKATRWLNDRGYKVTRHAVRRLMQGIELGDALGNEDPPKPSDRIECVEHNGDEMTASGICQARSLEALLDLLDVDLDTWYVERWIGNQWGKGDMWQIKAWFKRHTPEVQSAKSLLEDIRDNPVSFKTNAGIHHFVRGKDTEDNRRAIEISISDPHYGMRCFAGPSGEDWTPEDAENAWWSAYHTLIYRATSLAREDVDTCVLVLGNDFLHADNVFHTTTQGTGQPEMDSWHEMVRRGKRLLLETVWEASHQFRNTHVVFVPGNHARQTEYMLGMLVDEVFRHIDHISVDAGPEPYKFWRYGANLIGFDHGHSINPVRLGGIMAEERKKDWAETTYREWHLGDQHRKGVSRPTMEELGVSIEYLPSLIPWNEWHKIKGFSQQKRAAVGFVYDYEEGCIGKVQYNG